MLFLVWGLFFYIIYAIFFTRSADSRRPKKHKTCRGYIFLYCDLKGRYLTILYER